MTNSTDDDYMDEGDNASVTDDDGPAISADKKEESPKSGRLRGQLSKAVDIGKGGARASWSAVDSGVDAAVRAGKTVVEAGADQAQRAGGAARGAIDRIRDDDDPEQEQADFEPLWPTESGTGESGVAEKVLAETSPGALIEDVLTMATLTLGGVMAELAWEDDPDASNRIGMAIAPRIESLYDGANGGDPFDLERALMEVGSSLEHEQRTAALLDLWFIDPFSPYEIWVRRRVRRGALQRVADCLGLDEDAAERIRDSVREARSAHRTGTMKRMALFGVGGVLLVGTAGFLAAPAIATAIGSAAGLSGAAATSYGLALLGGGSLAAGGAGMTGGLWLVASAGGAFGLVGGAGGRGMYELGVNQLQIEVVKLQVSYKFLLLDQQIDMAKAQRVMTSLAERIEELQGRIEFENAINDKNSDRVEDLEAKLTILLSGQDWMEEQAVAA